MKKEKFSILALTAVLAMSAAPFASATDFNANSKGIINFDALDTDHDGRLTQIEFDANSNFKGEKFGDLDENDDGNIDVQELSTWARVNGKGNAVSSVNNATGTIGTTGKIGVPSVAPNVNATVNGSVNRSGAGAPIGAKANIAGSTGTLESSTSR